MENNIRSVAATLDTSIKVRFDEEFELVAMRWRYLLRSPNPTNDRMFQFETILKSTSRKIWRRFKYAYNVTGYDFDDVVALGRVHLVSYIGIFGLLEHPDKLIAFVQTFTKKNGKAPAEEDILRKDRANCASFLYQRLEEVAKICSQKNRNIRGTDGLRAAFIGESAVTEPDEAILANPEKYGLKKLTKKATEEMEANLKHEDKTEKGFKFEGKHVRVVELSPKPLNEVDAAEMFYNAYNSIYLQSPLEVLEGFNENVKDEEYRATFDSMEQDKKVLMLKKFIAVHKDKPAYADEIKAARDILNKL